MKTKNEDFRFLRALDYAAVLLLVLFIAFIIKTILAVLSSLQSEAFTNYIAGVSNI
jgi:hypothetical protein